MRKASDARAACLQTARTGWPQAMAFAAVTAFAPSPPPAVDSPASSARAHEVVLSLNQLAVDLTSVGRTWHRRLALHDAGLSIRAVSGYGKFGHATMEEAEENALIIIKDADTPHPMAITSGAASAKGPWRVTNEIPDGLPD